MTFEKIADTGHRVGVIEHINRSVVVTVFAEASARKGGRPFYLYISQIGLHATAIPAISYP